MTLSRKTASARAMSSGLARHRVGQEADEIAGMPGFERDADLAVGLEAADSRAVSGARIDDDERPPGRIDLDARRRFHPHETIVDRPLERSAIDDQLHLVVEHVRDGFGQMLAVLIAALAHDIPEQDAALRGVCHVFHAGSKHGERAKRTDGGCLLLAGRHVCAPCSCLSSLLRAMGPGSEHHQPLRQFRCRIISKRTLGSGSVCRFLPPYTSYGTACGACWVRSRRSCASTGEAVRAITAARMNATFISRLHCDQQEGLLCVTRSRT
jgi:hypothetical protein